MKILAIETASEACSAALLISPLKLPVTSSGDSIDKGSIDKEQLLMRVETTPRQHAKLILSMLDSLLEEGDITLQDIDAIAFGRGPGAFTGLRIAAGVTQGVALSVDKSVVPVSTLSALAQQAVDNHPDFDVIVVAMDARMGEVYWTAFDNVNHLDDVESALVNSDTEEQVSAPQTMLEEVLAYSGNNKKILAIGSGWDVYAETLFNNDMPENITHIEGMYPTASDIAKLAKDLFVAGKSVKAEDAQPVYIRNNVAKKSVAKKAGEQGKS